MKRLAAVVRRIAPVGAQVLGCGAAVCGVGLLLGVAWSLVIAGVSLAAVGTLAEMKGGR